jgi:nucleoside-diphosphate-sugar epimerase
VARVLVTGGCGFIGNAVASRLAARGDAVLAVDKADTVAAQASRASLPGLSFALGAVDDAAELAAIFDCFRPDAVVHCAAIVGVLNSIASPVPTLRVNIEGTLNVLAAARRLAVRRLVNLSTEEVYGAFTADRIDETHPCFPVQPYGISKFAAERLARDAAAEAGLSLVTVRTCWVYGPGLPRARVPNILIDAALDRHALHLPAGADFRVDHVHVDDAARGIILALDAPAPPHDVYHIATGEAPSLGDIAGIIRALVPGADISVGPGAFHFADGVSAVRKGALDITRARTELGYAPELFIRDGLAAHIAARRAGPT